jgi:uncharacterized protein YfbU (UPF0304 family)
MAARGERFEFRLEQEALDRIDDWRRRRADPDKPLVSRSEAARMLIDLGLDRGPPELSDGDRLILMLLTDLLKPTSKRSGVEGDFIIDAITGGHYWALDWQYPGLFHGHRDKPSAVADVLDILECWMLVETGMVALADKDRKYVLATTGAAPNFLGFDGNYEGEHLGIARFLVERMERFPHFKGRNFNSHVPVLDSYRRMARAFAPIRNTLHRREMSVSELITVFHAQRGHGVA